MAWHDYDEWTYRCHLCSFSKVVNGKKEAAALSLRHYRERHER